LVVNYTKSARTGTKIQLSTPEQNVGKEKEKDTQHYNALS